MIKKDDKKIKHKDTFEAKVDGSGRGFAFLVREGESKDLFVPASKTNGALHKDTVLAKRVEGTVDEAEVLKVLKRGITQLVGTVDKTSANCFVIPDEKRLGLDIFVPKGSDLKCKNHQKVVVKITSHPTEKDKNPEGEIVQILGYAGDKNADLLAVAYEFGLSQDFPDKVLQRAEKIPNTVTDTAGRRDLRDEVVITIDGEDAKDLDDAISIEKAGENFVLGVHIADVSHYVRPDDDIDKEAFKRGTSVYLPETVFPMLPQKLSNGICSLFQDVDRLTLSCFVTVTPKGKVMDFEVVESIIKSRRRMTYDQVQNFFDGEKSLQKSHPEIAKKLMLMKQLAEILISKRERRGNIDFQTKEVHFLTDEQGEIFDIVPNNRLFSHRLIEEFMILANETVANYAQHCQVPFVYRTHENPDSEKLQVLFALLTALGFSVKPTQEIRASALAKLLAQTENTPFFNLINDVMLRTMQKAKYTVQNIGHFGLASSCYCHFTSPIRRYPDLVVHRVLKTLIKGKMTEKANLAYLDMCQKTSVTSSICEKNAVEAERKADDVLKCRFAKKLLGQDFDGIISGVIESGIFVELPNTIEGFVSLENLHQSSLVFDKARFCLANQNTRFCLGDSLKVKIVSVNSAALKIDMELANTAKMSKKQTKVDMGIAHTAKNVKPSNVKKPNKAVDRNVRA